MSDWEDEGQALLTEGTEAWEKGDRLRAEAAFNKLVDKFPDRPEGYNKMGVVLAQTGELGEAERLFLRSLAQDRTHAPALTNLGNIYLERGDTDAAVKHYMLALQSDPDYAAAHRNLGVAYRRQGKYSAFVSHFKRSQRLDTKRMRGGVHPLGGRASPPSRGSRTSVPSFVWIVLAGIGVVILLSVFHW